MKITPTRVALAILVAAGISVAVWRMAPPAASTAPVEPARVAQPTPLPWAAVEARRGTLEPVPTTVSAPSDYAQAVTLVARANAGDARAQFRLADLIHECAIMRRLVERGVENDVAEACDREGVPAGDWRLWHDKAITAGDPIALLHAAFESKDEAAFAAAMDVAARSGDPEAHMALGHMLLTVDGADPIDAVAWMIVGCGDCTMDDPRLGFAACVDYGTCAANMRFVDWLASSEENELAPLQEAQARAASLVKLYGAPTE